MATNRDVWVMGAERGARGAIAAALAGLDHGVVEREDLVIDPTEWGQAGWPLLIAVVGPDGVERVTMALRAVVRSRLSVPVLVVLEGGGDVLRLVDAGAADVMRWPAESEMLPARLALLAARSGGELSIAREVLGDEPGVLYVYDVPTGAVIPLGSTSNPGLSPDALAELHRGGVGGIPDAAIARLADGERLVSEHRLRGQGGSRWVRVHTLVQDRSATGAARRLISVARDVSALRAPEESLRSMLYGTSAVGEGFLHALARELASFLGVRCVAIGEMVTSEAGILRTLAFWGDGVVQPPLAFGVAGTTVEEVAFGQVAHYPRGAGPTFPLPLAGGRFVVDGFFGLPVSGPDGRTVGMVLAWHDAPLEISAVTQELLRALAVRVGAELARGNGDAALQAEEERLRLATAAGGVGVWDWNIITDELLWTGYTDTIFGDARLAASRSTAAFWDRVHPADVRKARGAFQRALDGDERVAIELRFLRLDGTQRWIAVNGEMFRDAHREPVRMTGTVVDISTRRAAEERVRESEQRLQLALGGARAGIWDLDLERSTIYFSPEWESMLGYVAGTLPGVIETARDLAHPDDLPGVAAQLIAHVKGDTAVYESEHRMRHRDGTWIWVLDRGKVVERGADGRALRMTGIQTDISARKRLETQLLLADRMSTVGTLASGIAHEVNNPLAYVVGNLEYLVSLGDASPHPVNARTRRALTDAIDGAERVRAIVADLKTFAAGDDDVRRPVDVHQVLGAALRVSNNEIRHQTRLETVYDARRRVLGSEGKLAQAVVNLLSNALQALPPERSSDRNLIRVCTSDVGNTVVIEVEDNGVGMPAEVIRRVFDPFFTTHPVGASTGLGLTAVHNVIRAMDGRVEVESEVGRGSRFRLVLPAAPVTAEVSLPKPREAPAPVAGQSVLVIDDEPMIATVMSTMLKEAYAVQAVDGAAAALDMLESGTRFDVILCDLMMPSMTGMAFYDVLLQRWPEQAARTGFVTGGAFTRAAGDFVLQMQDRCIDKPFDKITLRRFVQRLSVPDAP